MKTKTECRKEVDKEEANMIVGTWKDSNEIEIRKELASRQGAKEEGSVGQDTWNHSIS